MQEINFDTALRYDPVIKIINKFKYKKYPILEVGSGMNGISDYYNGKVIGLDSDFTRTGISKNLNITHIRGQATKLPLKDNLFYIVICLDTLEHLLNNKREKVISELLRVTRKGGRIFLGFPSGDLSKKFEEKILHLYKNKYKKDHPWLIEHKIYGLPTGKQVFDVLQKKGIIPDRIKVINNANLLVWFVIHFLFTVHSSSIISKFLKLFYVVLNKLFKVHLPPYYRLIFIINK